MTKTLTGIYIVEKKYSLIWLKNDDKKLTQTMKYFDFKNMLYQSFDEKQINKILEILNCDEKLLIDFDNEKVKIIKQKEKDFFDEMTNYMNVNAVKNSLIDQQENFNWLNFGIDYRKE